MPPLLLVISTSTDYLELYNRATAITLLRLVLGVFLP
jgi:hypothetical protein